MRHAFEAALDEVEGRGAGTSPPVRVVPFLPPMPELVAGSHSLWEFAAAWTPEADPPPPCPAPSPSPRARPSARPEDIAEELGLNGLRTPADVARTRRRFMWDNHPDRRADLDRELANRRVAIANMLLDRVLAWHARRRR